MTDIPQIIVSGPGVNTFGDWIDVTNAIVTRLNAFGDYSSVTINGGTINGVSIGLTTPGAAKFTDIEVTGNATFSAANLVLADNQISGNKIAGGTIECQTVELSSAPSANNQATTKLYVDTFVAGTDNIATNAVTTGKILDGAVTANKLANGAATTSKIADNAVTTAKILDSNVTTAKIAPLAVTSAEINTDAVTTAKIVANAVTNTKLAQIATKTIKGRKTAATGNVEDLSVADAREILKIGRIAADLDISTSASTLGGIDGDYVKLIGSGTVTSFGTTPPIGTSIECEVGSVFTITNNANILCITGANIITQVGDSFTLVYSATNTWKMTSYTRLTGKPLANFADVQEVTSSTSLTPTSANDMLVVTALAAGLTINNPSGTMTQGQALVIRLKDNGTARALTWGSAYRAIGGPLPTTTAINKILYVYCVWNSTDSKFDVTGTAQQV